MCVVPDCVDWQIRIRRRLWAATSPSLQPFSQVILSPVATPHIALAKCAPPALCVPAAICVQAAVPTLFLDDLP